MSLLRKRNGGTSALVISALLLLCAEDAAHAQEASSPSDRLQELERAVVERDQRIETLEMRIARLEQLLTGGLQAQAAAPPAAVTPALPSPPQQAQATQAAQPPGLEENIDRALERALVQTGALLLRPGIVTIEPSFRYRRDERFTPTFFTEGDVVLSASDDVVVNTIDTDLTLRAGLPWNSQLEVAIPFRHREQTTVTTVAFVPIETREVNATGFGDLRLALSREMLRERGALPNVVASVVWDTDTGGSDEGMRLGTGFDEVGGFVTATKRLDPLVFLGSAGYTTAIGKGRVDPGDRVSFSLGTILAVSPETSLRLLLNHSFGNELSVDGRELPGSSDVVSVLSAGASVNVGSTLLDVVVGVGLTEESPDLSLEISLPIRTRLFR